MWNLDCVIVISVRGLNRKLVPLYFYGFHNAFYCYNQSADKVCTWPVAPLGKAKWLLRFSWYGTVEIGSSIHDRRMCTKVTWNFLRMSYLICYLTWTCMNCNKWSLYFFLKSNSDCTFRFSKYYLKNVLKTAEGHCHWPYQQHNIVSPNCSNPFRDFGIK